MGSTQLGFAVGPQWEAVSIGPIWWGSVLGPTWELVCRSLNECEPTLESCVHSVLLLGVSRRVTLVDGESSVYLMRYTLGSIPLIHPSCV